MMLILHGLNNQAAWPYPQFLFINSSLQSFPASELGNATFVNETIQAGVDDTQMIWVFPRGEKDITGMYFWNAGTSSACCDFFHARPDDIGYLNAVIDDVVAKFPIDPDRIFVFGHSNGAFMALRLACEAESAARISAIVSFEGQAPTSSSDASLLSRAKYCQPEKALHLLTVHSHTDEIISDNGGEIILATYPSSKITAAMYAAKFQCANSPTINVSALSTVDDHDTTQYVWSNCQLADDATSTKDDNSAVISNEWWAIKTMEHIPKNLRVPLADLIVPWFQAHPRPTNFTRIRNDGDNVEEAFMI